MGGRLRFLVLTCMVLRLHLSLCDLKRRWGRCPIRLTRSSTNHTCSCYHVAEFSVSQMRLFLSSSLRRLMRHSMWTLCESSRFFLPMCAKYQVQFALLWKGHMRPIRCARSGAFTCFLCMKRVCLWLHGHAGIWGNSFVFGNRI